MYQGTVLQGYSSAVLQQCGKCAVADFKRLIHEMLEWLNVEMLRFILVFLDTQSWVENEDSESDDLSEIYAAVEYIRSSRMVIHNPSPAITIKAITNFQNGFFNFLTKSFFRNSQNFNLGPKWDHEISVKRSLEK